MAPPSGELTRNYTGSDNKANWGQSLSAMMASLYPPSPLSDIFPDEEITPKRVLDTGENDSNRSMSNAEKLNQALEGGWRAQHDLLKSEAEIHSQKALDYYQQAQNAQASLTGGQALTAALLAAIPTVGGYMVGKSVGTPKIPMGANPAYASPKTWTGPDVGMAEGAALGGKAAGTYIKGFDEQAQRAANLSGAMARVEEDKATKAEAEDTSTIKAALSQKESRDELIQMELAGNPAARSVYYRISAGEAVPREEVAASSISPRALTSAQAGVRSIAYQQSVDMRKQGLMISGYTKADGSLPTPGEKQLIETQNQGNARTVTLLAAYIENPDSIAGQESALQQAIYGLSRNAQRLATGSGANFTVTEQKLVDFALPKILAGDPVGAMVAAGFGRDQKAFAAELINLYQKVQDYSLFDAYGLRRNDVGFDYYPEGSVKKILGVGSVGSTAAPAATQQKLSIDDRLKAMREEEAKNARIK
jgi:hypothetical protein